MPVTARLRGLAGGSAGLPAVRSPARPFGPLTGLLCGLLCAVLTGLFSAAAAQGAEDTIAQRVSACTVCHGREGRATPDGYFPRIAGKPAGYLEHQLRNFRDGRRGYPAMVHLVEFMTDAYLAEIAGYFAALDLPYEASKAPPPEPELARRGEALARRGDPARELPACAACHGAALTGVMPATPGLLGLPRDYLNAQLGAWRNGQRRALAPDCMARVAAKLAPDEIGAVTHWLAAQPLPADTHPAAAGSAGALPMACGSVGP